MTSLLERVLPALDDAGIDYDLPSDWGAEIDYTEWSHDQSDDNVFVHWGGSQVRETAEGGNVQAERATLRDWEHYHVHRKGWRGIAYDLAIGNSGRVYVCRGNARSAATSGDMDEDGIPNNAESDAVVLLVGQGQEASPAALASLKVVCDAARPTNGVYGHADAAGTRTACPGPQLRQWVADYRAGDVTDDGGRPPRPDEDSPAPDPASDDGSVIGAIVNDLPVLSRQERYRKDPHVQTVQAAVTYRWGLPTTIDGYFGPDTERKVREVQQRAHAKDDSIHVDGIVGKQTWQLLLLGRLAG